MFSNKILFFILEKGRKLGLFNLLKRLLHQQELRFLRGGAIMRELKNDRQTIGNISAASATTAERCAFLQAGGGS